MSRYIREVQLNRPEEFVQFIIGDFLNQNGFQLENFKGENVYRTGGVFSLLKLFTWGYQNGIVHIEAWTRTTWLPGLYGGENGLTGFYGALPKSMYKDDVENLIRLLCQPLPNPNQQ